MIIPIRCFSCGKPIAHLWEKFLKIKEEKGIKKALDELKIDRYCCRSVFLGHIDLINIVGRYKN